MNNWEETIKEMLEGYESPLPEGSLDEFHTRKKAWAKTASIKRLWPVWLATAAAAAFYITLVQYHHHSNSNSDIKQLNQSPKEMVVDADFPPTNESPALDISPLSALMTIDSPQQLTVKKPSLDTNLRQSVVQVEYYSSNNCEKPTEERHTAFEKCVPEQPQYDNVENLGLPDITYNVLKPDSTHPKITGSILVAAGPLPAANEGTANLMTQKTRPTIYPHTHYLPIKAGVTAAVPISDKLSIHTGVNYCLYMSSYTYRISPTQFGENIQYVHYLGIPICLNWKFGSTGCLDYYIGAGLEKAFFMGASLAGSKIKKDGGYLSLLGSCGVQWNTSKLIGIYLEPSMSWSILSNYRIMETYLTEHPFTFLIATGIRINLTTR